MRTGVGWIESRFRRQDPSELRGAAVLLAEDDEEMRELLASELRADGYTVTALADGNEMLAALSELRRKPHALPDVIIMDVRMPGCSGLHILAALRAAEWVTPVVLITAFGDRRLHQEAERFGVAAVFDKPFDLDDLRTALLHLCRHRPQSCPRMRA